jgi:hypothetical protein
MTSAALAIQMSPSVTEEWPRTRKEEEGTKHSSFDEADFAFIDSLAAVIREGEKPDWDGRGAKAISDGVVRAGLEFYYLLPSTLPKPDVTAHPNGDLAFEWYFAPRRVLTVAVNESGRLNYAWMMGLERQYGTKYLSAKLPEEITAALRSIRFRDEPPIR